MIDSLKLMQFQYKNSVAHANWDIGFWILTRSQSSIQTVELIKGALIKIQYMQIFSGGYKLHLIWVWILHSTKKTTASVYAF